MVPLLFLFYSDHCVVYAGFLITAIVQNSDSQTHDVSEENASLPNAILKSWG